MSFENSDLIFIKTCLYHVLIEGGIFLRLVIFYRNNFSQLVLNDVGYGNMR